MITIYEAPTLFDAVAKHESYLADLKAEAANDPADDGLPLLILLAEKSLAFARQRRVQNNP